MKKFDAKNMTEKERNQWVEEFMTESKAAKKAMVERPESLEGLRLMVTEFSKMSSEEFSDFVDNLMEKSPFKDQWKIAKAQSSGISA